MARRAASGIGEMISTKWKSEWIYRKTDDTAVIMLLTSRASPHTQQAQFFHLLGELRLVHHLRIAAITESKPAPATCWPSAFSHGPAVSSCRFADQTLKARQYGACSNFRHLGTAANLSIHNFYFMKINGEDNLMLVILPKELPSWKVPIRVGSEFVSSNSVG